ncbi:hypothetical protein [Cupriavidus malaysiensis]|uniref:VWFA domain-containing protein n=1 Tax=Cupriavidus malaysiensis TaxID=367825 RepID=A0ABM6FGN4_9BURK|nr:hypothetical protein [Cupriavidus malaysiensis]AOZ11113.1 hypothetical protein BKK80_34710 [Cupriavidus malaysiensis]
MAMTVRALQLLASMIGRRRNVSVIFDPAAETAYTDGKRVVLPVVSALGSEEHGILINGLLDHECAHLRYTWFDAWETLKRQPPITGKIANIIEDVWIEREQARILPGSYRNIVASMDVMIRLGWYGSAKVEPQALPKLFTNWLLTEMLGRHYRDDRLVQYAAAHCAALSSQVGPQLVDAMRGIAVQVDQVHDTHRATQLACEIVSLLSHEAKQQAKHGAPSPLTALLGATAPNLGETDRGRAMVALLQQAGVMSKGDASGGRPYGAAEGEGSLIAPTEAAGHKYEAEQDAARAAAGLVEQTLGMRLEALLEARTMTGVTYSRSGGRLDGRRLAGMRLGALDVFRHVSEGAGLSTAVAILLDTSGSMSRPMGAITRSTAAAAIAIAAGRVLGRHDVPLSLHGFGDGVTQFKDFGDPWAPTERYCLVHRQGATKLEFGLQRIADPLLGRTETRRLVLVVTDGNPDDEELSLAVVEELSAIGIEFAFLFVGSDGDSFEHRLLGRSYEVSRARDVSGFAAAIFEAIQRAV